MSWAERSTGICRPSPIPARTCSGGSTASTPISPDIDAQIEARLARFHVEDDPGHQGLIAEDLGAASTPLVLAQVEC
jgi:hypothetical protein